MQTDWTKPLEIEGSYTVMVADDYVPWSPGKLVMVGHGVPIGKTYGLDQPHPYFHQRQSKLIDYVVCAGQGLVSIVARQSGVPQGRVLPLGMPRTDALVGRRKGDGRTMLAFKRSYLYCPTFRNQREPPMPAVDWDYLDRQLDDGEILAVKPHMVTGHILEGKYRHILEIPSDVPTAPFLVDCDVLVTDYSSILFDGHICGKPVVLFEKDRAAYLGARGMYLPYPDGYAARHCSSEETLLQTIRAATDAHPLDRDRAAAYCGSCDGKAAQRLVDFLRRIA